jgi:hypothetical protein
MEVLNKKAVKLFIRILPLIKLDLFPNKKNNPSEETDKKN